MLWFHHSYTKDLSTVGNLTSYEEASDANGQSLAYVWAREIKVEADIAKVLTFDEARRIAVNVAGLPELLKGVGQR